MLEVKVSTCAPSWPWARQTPGSSLVWDGIRFHVDREVERCDAWIVFESLAQPQSTACPPGRAIFITGEPDPIGSYDQAFLDQFAHVVTSRKDVRHPHVIRRQQGHPWFVEKSYDELIAMQPVAKTADVCVITSDKVFTAGHRERLQFALELKARLGARVDLWGRGLRDFVSSWDVLSRYRYAVVLENHADADWLTEKLPDAMLAWCVPLYHGCTNLADYLPAGSWIDLQALDAGVAAERLLAILDDPADYEARLPRLAEARVRYLQELQFFANAARIVRQVAGEPSSAPAPVVLHPNGAVPTPAPVATPAPLPTPGEASQPPATAAPVAAPEPQGVKRKLAGAFRLAGWRLLLWADHLRPLPPPAPAPTPAPTSEPTPAPAPTPVPVPRQPPTLRHVAHESWLRADGEQTLRLEYAIAPGETVLDLGGFEGQWASDVFGRSLCELHVFEPVPQFASAIRRRFAGNPHVRVHDVALGGVDGTLSVPADGASSRLLPGENTCEVRVRRFADVVQEQGWQEIALMKVNIEGGEYELLEHLLDCGLAGRVRNLQVQFHDFVPGAHARMLAIQERLRTTHRLTYYFPFVWENWQRKESAP